MAGDTHSCADCGGGGGTNLLSGQSCNNPCGAGPTNSAACETLPSQIQNFTQQFFGDVVKTEVDGVVSWSLPCSLDIGLPANPRGVGEGLACYFLRLFNEGIVGLKGDPGTPGASGSAGANAFTVTMHSFTQPTIGSPNVQVLTAFNPVFALEGMYVFIDTSGWYIVNGSDGNGTLFLTLVKPLPSPPATVAAGKLVLPAGIPGLSVVGPQGLQGPKGDTGSPGVAYTLDNGVYTASVGTDYPLPITFTAVDFVNSAPQFVATAQGTYLVTVTAVIQGQTGIAASDFVSMELRNTSLFADVVGSRQTVSGIANLQYVQVVCSALVTTTAPGQTIAVFAECSTVGKAKVLYSAFSMNWVRVA